jgi:DNA-binding MarR family transcriptional regulator
MLVHMQLIVYCARVAHTKPTEAAITAWARLIRVQQALLEYAEADLKAAGLPPLVWYDVLLELVREPEGRIRHRDLHRRMLLAKYNLSRLLDRMEANGLVGREPVDDDARGEYLRVTPEGREMQHRMWPVYRCAIVKNFSAPLTADDVGQLLRILSKLG